MKKISVSTNYWGVPRRMRSDSTCSHSPDSCSAGTCWPCPWQSHSVGSDDRRCRQSAGSKAHSATYAQEGGHWIYDVIVVKGKSLTEVEVDATTGKAGDTEAATPEQEGKEITAELNKAIGNTSKSAPEKDEKEEKEEKPEKTRHTLISAEASRQSPLKPRTMRIATRISLRESDR